MEGLLSSLVKYQKLFQMILVLGIGGNLTIGYQISVINYPSVYIKRFMNETWFERSGSPLHETTLMFLWSIIVSVYGIGGLLGCLSSGYLTVKYGKKKSMLGTDLLILATTFLVGLSKTAKSFEMILIGRFLFGISAGFCMTIHPQYVGEISPKRLRGFANATSGFFWSLGKSLGQILGLRECLGTESSWPLLLAFIGIAALFQLLTLPFFPESPPYLLIQKEDEGGCLQAMHSFWGPGTHQEELSDLKLQLATGKSSKVLSAWELVTDRAQRRQLCVLVVLVLAIQLCGINAVYFYTFEVFRTAGFEEHLIPYISLGLGFCELFAAVLCTLTIDRYGRRTLLWKGYGMMGFVLLLLTISLSLQDKSLWMPYCSTTLLFLFVIFFGIGPNGATLSVMMEIFNQSSRPAAFLIGGCLNWAGLFIIGIGFPFAVESLGPFCFLIFMAILAGTGMFFYLLLPETKGKSIAEITEEFSMSPFRNKLPIALRQGFREASSAYTSF